MNKEELRGTAKKAGVIGLAAFIGSIIGFFLQLLVAYHFGASGTTDAFFMAQSTSELLGKLLMGGSITAVFIPLFVHKLAQKKTKEAWDLGLNIVNIMAFAYIIAIIVIWIGSSTFIRIIAPGFTGETYNLTVSLLRILLPSFFFLFLVEFATSMLHSFKEFALPASLRIVSPTVSIISILLLVKSFGIYAFAIGVVAGSFIQLLILAWGLARKGMRYRFFINIKDPSIRSLATLVYPFILSVLMTQGAGIVYRVLVSSLTEGSLSALKYAEKITQLITIIFLNSVTMVIYPLLSEKASLKDTAGMRNTIGSSMRLIVFTTLPLILAVAILRHDIVSFLYERGSFSAQDVEYTSLALLYLVLGLTTTGISSILGHAVLALQETKAAVAITISSQAVAISLFALLVPYMGFAGLALASSLVPLSSALLYYLYLTRFISQAHRIFIHSSYIKTISISIISAGAIWLISTVQLPYIVSIIIPILVGCILYLTLAYVFKIEEMNELMGMVQKRFKKS